LNGVVAQTCRTLGTFLKTALPLNEALQVEIEAAKNVHLREAYQ